MPKPADKVLPEAIDVERLVLGTAMTQENTLATIVSELTLSEFSLHKHKIIFEAIQNLAAKGIAPDRVVLYEYLENQNQVKNVDGLSYLSSLDEGIPKSPNWQQWLEILKEKSRLRRMLRIAAEIDGKVQDGSFSSADIMESALQKLYGSFGSTKTDGLVPMGKFIEQYPGGIGRLLDPSKSDPGMPTGLRTLDDLTGGMHNDEIWVFAARPSQGKTAVGCNIAINLSRRGRKVLIFSQEMSQRQLFNRMVCDLGNVPLGSFKRGDLNSDERERIQNATAELLEMPLEIDEGTGKKVSDIRLRVEQAHKTSPVSMVLIDYIQLMRAEKASRSSNQDEKYTEICNGIQQLAKDTHIPFVVLSQLNREFEKASGKNKRPTLSQCRGSGSIEQITNVGICLFREEMYNKDREELRGLAEFIVEKNRDGEAKTLKMRFKGWLCRFEDWD